MKNTTIGIFIFATDYAMRIDDLARETEARGFESLFVPEHTHVGTVDLAAAHGPRSPPCSSTRGAPASRRAPPARWLPACACEASTRTP